jgi:UDP-glucose 4-epimerase
MVTGGAGFIGSHLVDCLVADGKDVTVLDDFSSGTDANLVQAFASGRLRVVRGSVLSLDDLHNAMVGCDAVFHLAVRSVRHSLGDPLENHHVNSGGTINTLEVARRQGVRRFVYCSSSEVYGNATGDMMREDTTLCRPVTVYGGSKLAGEHYTAAYRDTYGLPAVIVRPFNAYGPRAHLHGLSGEVIPRFFARILSGLSPIIFGDGNQTRDFTFVTDTARGIALAGEKEAALGNVINIAAGCAVSIRALARKIADICGHPDINLEFYPQRPGDVRALWADVSRCRPILDFQPSVTLEDGLRQYIAWLEKEVFESPLSLTGVQSQNWVQV